MLLIVLVVIFIMAMAAWGYANLKGPPNSQWWLAWFAVLVLGITVFLLGSGSLVWRSYP